MMSTEERWVHIAKLEEENRDSQARSAALKHKHQSKMKHMTDISNAVVIAMSIFSPAALMLPPSKRKEND
jgi:membrane protein insertase Oxa1/YidC/SpoIIIJ